MGTLRSLRTRLPRAGGQEGFTLVELLVATMLSVMLVIGIQTFATVAQRSQSNTGARADALTEQRAGLERMTRELRQATTIDATTPGLVTFDVYGANGGAMREIRYDCRTSARCRRYEGPVGGPLTITQDPFISSVQSATFATSTFAASQDYVTIDLRVSLPGRAMPIALSDGVNLRNKSGL